MQTPDINSLNFFAEFDPLTDKSYLHFDILFSENFSSATSIQLLYWKVNEKQTWITIQKNQVTGSFSSIIELPTYAVSGVYAIRTISITENSGINVSLNEGQLSELQLKTTTILENPKSDDLLPYIRELNIGSYYVDNIDRIHIPVEVSAADDESGLSKDFVVEILSPSGASLQQWAAFDTTGNAKVDFILDKYAASGNYKVNTIRLYDLAGNNQMSQAWLSKTPKIIDISNPNSDSISPELSKFLIEAVYDENTNRPIILINGLVSEPNSGLNGVYVRFRSPTGIIIDAPWLSYSKLEDGKYSFNGKKALSTEFTPGEYLIDYVFLQDKAGNKKYFTHNENDDGLLQKSIRIYFPTDIDQKVVSGSNSDDYVFGSNLSSDVLSGDKGADYLYASDGSDTVDGGEGDDTVQGGSGNDELIGGAGSDTLDGGEGEDCADYADRITGIFLSLVDGMAKGNQAEVDLWTDKLISIENACGGAGDDQISGNAGSNKLEGRAGNDTLNGGAGFDYVEYVDANSGVIVDLQKGTAQDGFGTQDQLSSIEGILGSAFHDQLIGDDRMNKFWGMEGNDSIDGDEGYDEAYFHGTLNDYKIEQLADGTWRVTDNRTAAKDVVLDGVDVLSHVEKLVFSDTTKTLSELTLNQGGSQTLHGQVYAWKNHVLLSDVQLTLTQLTSSGPSKAQIFEFKNLQKTAAGDYEAELWVNLNTGVGSLDLSLQFDKTFNVSLAENLSSLPSGWSLISGSEAGSWTMGAMGLTNAQGSINLGKMTFDLPTGTSGGTITIVDGTAGDPAQSAYALQLGAGGSFQTGTGPDGQFSWSNLTSGTYSAAVTKPLTSLETGGAISSADALAALKIAVGRNPNLDGTAISPYQLIAADVNQDGKVTSADALAILKMAVKRSDAPTREWLFVRESQDFWDEAANNGQGGLTISRTNVTWNKDLQATVSQDTTVNILAVLKGDVNGSWTGATGSQSLPNSYFSDLVKKGLGPLSTWGVVVA